MKNLLNFVGERVPFLKQLLDKKNISLLDIGCGSGDIVYAFRKSGFQAYGTDIEFKEGAHTKELEQEGVIRKIGDVAVDRTNAHLENPVWPFDSNMFELSLSKAVIEHVIDLDFFVKENSRVSKSNALAVHYFASRHAIIEPHIGIPFGALFVNKQYFKIVSKMGLCFKRYRNNGEAAYEFMTNHTKYRNLNAIVEVFERNNFKFIGAYPDAILQSRGSLLWRFMSKVYFVDKLFGLARSNVLVFQKV